MRESTQDLRAAGDEDAGGLLAFEREGGATSLSRNRKLAAAILDTGNVCAQKPHTCYQKEKSLCLGLWDTETDTGTE